MCYQLIMVSDLWQELEIRHIVALNAIAEEGTFAAAAARLGYTQSAISQQIAALERIVGESLLQRTRGRRPLGLTPAGTLVLRHGQAMVARVQAAQADLRAAAAGAAGPLRIGTYPSVGARILPELLQPFGRDWPELEVQLHESNADSELLALVEQGELDLALCMLPLPDGPLDAAELLLDPWLLVLPTSEDSLGANGSRAWPANTLPLLCFRTCPVIEEIGSLVREWGREPRVVFRSDDNATLQSLVIAGVGAAFMPCLTVNLTDPRTVFVDVRGMLAPRRVGIAWHRDRRQSTASQAFVDAAKKVAKEIEESLAPTTLLPPELLMAEPQRGSPRSETTAGIDVIV
jgi:DNA-binding transcriptional LysR family regulator